MTTKAPKGRADTFEKKKAVLDRLYQAWLKVPDQRLGQLLVNALRPVSSSPVVYYAEDETLVEKVEKFVSPKMVVKSSSSTKIRGT